MDDLCIHADSDDIRANPHTKNPTHIYYNLRLKLNNTSLT